MREKCKIFQFVDKNTLIMKMKGAEKGFSALRSCIFTRINIFIKNKEIDPCETL